MRWYALNKKYVNYLKKFDKIVPNIDYTGRLKCFLGVIFKDNKGLDYFAPLTSYKPKFITMKNDIDFLKIVGKNGKIYGAIDINNMIPVPRNEYTEITLNNLSTFRNFQNLREMKSYWKLLQTELSCINEKSLLNNAEKLYRFVLKNPNSTLAQRCCNFPLLEEKCIEYCKVENKFSELNNINNKEDLYYLYDSLNDKSLFEDTASFLNELLKTEDVKIQDISMEKLNNIFNSTENKETNSEENNKVSEDEDEIE